MRLVPNEYKVANPATIVVCCQFQGEKKETVVQRVRMVLQYWTLNPVRTENGKRGKKHYKNMFNGKGNAEGLEKMR